MSQNCYATTFKGTNTNDKKLLKSELWAKPEEKDVEEL